MDKFDLNDPEHTQAKLLTTKQVEQIPAVDQEILELIEDYKPRVYKFSWPTIMPITIPTNRYDLEYTNVFQKQVNLRRVITIESIGGNDVTLYLKDDETKDAYLFLFSQNEATFLIIEF